MRLYDEIDEQMHLYRRVCRTRRLMNALSEALNTFSLWRSRLEIREAFKNGGKLTL